jgi:hypothetical protein
VLYRILKDLGSMDPRRREAAIRMARGLPWEDLDQFLSFYDKSLADLLRSVWMTIIILLVVGAGTVTLFHSELARIHKLAIYPAALFVALLPFPVWLNYAGSTRRSRSSLQTILTEMDDPAFVATGLCMLSEAQADHYSFRPELFQAIMRLLPDVTLEGAQDWTPEERNALTMGLHGVLPTSAGGRDSLSRSSADFAIAILKVIQRIGDAREIELVRLVSTIDPITEKHQAVREASLKCLKTLERRIADAPAGSGIHTKAPVNGPLLSNKKPVSRTEVDASRLLKPRTRNRPETENSSAPIAE